MGSQRKAGAALGYVNIVVKNLVNLVYTPMLLAFIGEGEYGVYQTSYQFVFSLQILSFGFSSAYVRFYTQRKVQDDEKGIRTLNGMYLMLYSVICIAAIAIGLVLSGLCGQFFSSTFSAQEIDLAGIIMAIMTFNVATTLMSTVFDAYIVSHERFSFQQTRQLLTTLAMPVLALVLLMLGMGAVGVSLAQLATSLVLLGLNAAYAIGKLSMRFSIRGFDGNLFCALAAFSAWLFINQLTDLAVLNLPSVFLGALSGATTVAVFTIATQLRTLFVSISTTLSNVFVPQVNLMVANSSDDIELTRLMTRIGRYQAILFCWVFGGFVLLGEWFVRVWAGEAFADAYWITLITVAPLAIPLIQNVGIEIQRTKNKHKARSISYLVCALADLIITCALAPKLGYWGAAIGCICYAILGPGLFMNWYNQTQIGLDMGFFWKKIVPIFLSCALITMVCYLGTSLFPVVDLVSFLAWGAIYSLVYAAVIMLLVMDNSEKSLLIGKLENRLFRRDGC